MHSYGTRPKQVGRKRKFIFPIVLIITSVISFMAGNIVASMNHRYTKRYYEKQVSELEQQLATYKSEVSHYRSKSNLNRSGDVGSIDWTDLLKK